jgi:two-component system sensor histidine kinase ChvG
MRQRPRADGKAAKTEAVEGCAIGCHLSGSPKGLSLAQLVQERDLDDAEGVSGRASRPALAHPFTLIRRIFGNAVFSSLTRRILFFNLAALVVLVGGILYLNQFREG